MAKKKTVRKNKKVNNTKVQEIESKRNGGQIALRGFSYQLIYSCYKVLEFIDNTNKDITFEGIEDVDTYKYNALTKNDQEIEHIQLKYSQGKEDASFFDDILKNYLEVYLGSSRDETRYFKLVYDLEIVKGNLTKLINNNLDKKSEEFWTKKIMKIKSKNPKWNWEEFEFGEFYKQLRFQNFSKDNIIKEIERLIIKRFEVNTGSEELFLNSIFYNVFHLARDRSEINYELLMEIIQNTKDYISMGDKNPAYAWIEKVTFNIGDTENKSQYFEGKKPTIEDIVKGLPVRRTNIEGKVKTSINENKITVIKSSSGQGKTTLAWQVANDLKEEYSVYRLNWCKDTKEINNIVEYFNSRLKLGEKLLIIIDNLDNETKEWNRLAQELAEKIKLNYKIIITAREEDWYQFSGDQSKIGQLNIVDLYLEYKEAEIIYKKLKEKGKIHESINNWQSIWERVQERKVLIEYIYLLTHGEMIEERISSQLKKILSIDNINLKYDILRLVSLADIVGIKIAVNKLVRKIKEKYALEDLNDILKSIENEYMIKFSGEINYIEGLHPVRSKYILDILHEYHPIDNTFIELLSIVDEAYVENIYANIPLFVIEDKEVFYKRLVSNDVEKSYKYISSAIKGIFSGVIQNYYKNNKDIIDDADKHGGLVLLVNDINPWNNKDLGPEVKALNELNRILPDNGNVEYLLNLVRSIDKHNIKASDYYIYSYYLYNELRKEDLKLNKEGFIDVANWLRRIDKRFNMLSKIDLNDIWEYRDEWKFEELADLMYVVSIMEADKYSSFIKKHKEEINLYLKINTDSLVIDEKGEEIHIKYVLLPDEIVKANEESVKRINLVCKMLPIYKVYCTDAIRPNIEYLDKILIVDDAHRTMPIENVTISSNSDLNALWRKSIVSKYEFSSVYDWQFYWISMRKEIVELFKLNYKLLETLMKKQVNCKDLLKRIDAKREIINNAYIRENKFPNEERPFEKRLLIPDLASKIKEGYITSIFNYCSQMVNVINSNSTEHVCNLAVYNLKNARNELSSMQNNFKEIMDNTFKYFNIDIIELEEREWIEKLIKLIEYYIENKNTEVIYDGFNSLQRWSNNKNMIFMNNINSVIDFTQELSKVDITKPLEIIGEGLLKIVPIIIPFSAANDEAVMVAIAIGLSKLTSFDINYVKR